MKNGANGKDSSKWFHVSEDSRSWEEFYRKRWNYDYSVRTGHGVNCGMACSWEVFVKDGLICWELQKTDYPQIDPDIPILNQEVVKEALVLPGILTVL